MSFYTEQAISSKARCKNCKVKIDRDTLKLIYEGRGFSFPIKYNYCSKCGKEIIEREIKQLNELLKELK